MSGSLGFVFAEDPSGALVGISGPSNGGFGHEGAGFPALYNRTCVFLSSAHSTCGTQITNQKNSKHIYIFSPLDKPGYSLYPRG